MRVWWAVPGSVLPDHPRDDIDLYRQYVARFTCNDPVSYAFILRALAEVDFTGIFEAITCPTALISGATTWRGFSRHCDDLKEIRGATFLEIEGGHIPSVQAPLALAKALNAVFKSLATAPTAKTREIA